MLDPHHPPETAAAGTCRGGAAGLDGRAAPPLVPHSVRPALHAAGAYAFPALPVSRRRAPWRAAHSGGPPPATTRAAPAPRPGSAS